MYVFGVLNYRDDLVQKKFINDQNLDNRGSPISRIEISMIKELLLWMESFHFNPGIARITVIKELLYQ